MTVYNERTIPTMRACSPAVPLLLALAVAACSNSDGPNSPETGNALVRVQLTGAPTPALTYRVTVDGAELHRSTAADSLLLESLSTGRHSVLVEPLALNCIPEWYVAQTVTIASGKTSTVTFPVRCIAPVPAGIVFSSSRDNFRRNIYRMDADGGNVQRLTTYDLGDDHPVVGAGGTRIAFERQESIGLPQIWVMDADGSHVTKVSASTLLEQSPVWSPDGRRLAFIRWEGVDSMTLMVSTPDGRSEARLLVGRRSFGALLSSPLWSPNGRRITVNVWDGATYNNIRVVDVETGLSRDVPLPRDSLQASAVAWTPDGRLLFKRLHKRAGVPDDLRIGAIDGSSDQALMDSPAGLVSAAYSPDGLSIALTAYDTSSVFDVFRVPAAGGSLVNLTNAPQAVDLSPSWIP